MQTARHWGLAPRLILSLSAAICTTFFLLFTMAHLIHTDIPVLDEEPYPKIPPVVMEVPTREEPQFIKPEPMEQLDPLPPRVVPEWVTPDEPTVTIPSERVRFPRDPVIGTADSLPFARVMAPPTYPYQAARRGIEGFVDLRFDVTASGATDNIQVIYAEPEGVFEQSARAAIARWRFQPQMVNNTPTPFVGLSRRIRFTLDD